MLKRDAKAIEILLRTFWSSARWRDPPLTAPEDFEYAKSLGVMFDPSPSMTHDAVIRDVHDLARGLKASAVSRAFVASLTNRQLECRSALGSYAVARVLPEHDFVPYFRSGESRCAICGLARVETDIDWNILNFERFKWGGVRRDDLIYIRFDLEQFSRRDGDESSDEDVRLFRQLISALEALPPATTAPQAEAALRCIPSNKSERGVVLDILGVCGVLETTEHRGYSEAFVPGHERSVLPLRFVERAYPVCWWKASDGVNHAALDTFELPV